MQEEQKQLPSFTLSDVGIPIDSVRETERLKLIIQNIGEQIHLFSHSTIRSALDGIRHYPVQNEEEYKKFVELLSTTNLTYSQLGRNSFFTNSIREFRKGYKHDEPIRENPRAGTIVQRSSKVKRLRPSPLRRVEGLSDFENQLDDVDRSDGGGGRTLSRRDLPAKRSRQEKH